MKLADFLSEKNITGPDFGRQIGVSGESVRRYCDGERIPKRSVMVLIFEVTGGLVSANDFFGICEKSFEDSNDAAAGSNGAAA
jgi:hypothetical protein